MTEIEKYNEFNSLNILLCNYFQKYLEYRNKYDFEMVILILNQINDFFKNLKPY